MKKGLFIVFDGNDGSGKATQSKLLLEYFLKKNISAQRVDFPAYDTNFFGSLLGECLAGKHGDFVNLDPKIASSLYALDRFESTPLIRKALYEGTVIIADRFTSANQIHQGGKISNNEEREKFMEWLDTMEHAVLGIPRPDKIIYLRVPLEISLDLLQKKRAQKNQTLGTTMLDTVEEDRQYLERSHKSAGLLLQNQTNWTCVDCEKDGAIRSIEDIHIEVVREVEELLAIV